MPRLLTGLTVVALSLAFVVPEHVAASSPQALEVSLGGRALQPGEVVRVEVGGVPDGAALEASVFGVSVPLVSRGGSRWQGLVGIDLERTPGSYALAVSCSKGLVPPVVTTLEIAPKAFRTRTLRVAQAFVTPPPEVSTRIARELKVTEAIFATLGAHRWEGPFVPPLTSGSADNFGVRSVFNGQPRRPHAGLDYSVPAGTPIRAPAAGRVVLSEELYFTGRTVILDHGAGLYSLFAHLSDSAVHAGEDVTAGALLGRVGATGRATGPHLHWGVRLHGARVDPLSLLHALGPATNP